MINRLEARTVNEIECAWCPQSAEPHNICQVCGGCPMCCCEEMHCQYCTEPFGICTCAHRDEPLNDPENYSGKLGKKKLN